MKNGTADWAGSDSEFSFQEAAAHPELIFYPMIGGAVLPVCNLPITNASLLVLSRKALVDIFTANVTWWNDSSIVSLNPTLVLPQEKIRVIVRSDGSG
jgi:phosphate transport system substrate-binding protein